MWAEKESTIACLDKLQHSKSQLTELVNARFTSSPPAIYLASFISADHSAVVLNKLHKFSKFVPIHGNL